jgi:hypothetical protein
VLPAGSTVVFFIDGHLDVGAKPGSSVRVHLRDDLVLDGTTIAPAGTPARLIVGGVTTVAGSREAQVSLDGFVSTFGLLPVRPVTGTLAVIDNGRTVEATTLARVSHLGDRFAIEIPFPFKLSSDAPLSVYTPTPAKTAPPRTSVGPAAQHTPVIRGTAPPAPEPNPTATPTGIP